MADNVTAGAPVGTGSVFGAAELTFSGDTVQVPLGINGLLTGTEGAYTYSLVVGNTGVVTAGTQRVTLATDVALPTGSNVIGGVTQSGTWNVTNISGTVSLPTGAATAAKQPALGTAGTASSDVITVQGIASMTPVLVTLSGTNNLTGNQAVNIVQVAGSAVATGNGTAAGSVRVSLASDSTGIVALTTSTAEVGNVKNSGTFAVQNNGHGKTIKNYTNTISATTSIIAAVASKRIKVFSISLITASTTAVTVTFKDGAGGTALYTVPLQAITGTNFGLTQSVTLPTFLFATSAGVLLEAAFSAAQSVTINVSYWDDDAT